MSAVTLISALPYFVSPEQHEVIVSTTPSSLADIPPVLRYKQEDVRIQFEPPIPQIETNTVGTLYVVESVLAFIANTSSQGFQISYPKITLHAVARDDTGPSIYCQLDEQPENVQATEDDDTPMRELKIMPSDPAAVEGIFEALSQCAALHPDPEETGDDADDNVYMNTDDAAFEPFTGGPDEELSEAGRAALANLKIYDENGKEVSSDEEEEEEDESHTGKKETL